MLNAIFFIMYLGRFVNIPDNFKDKKIGKKIYEILKNYLSGDIKLSSIKNVSPNAFQIFIGPRHTRSGKNIKKYISTKCIKKIRELIEDHNARFVIHSNYLTQLTHKPTNNKKTLLAVINELNSGELLGADGVIVHLGSINIRHKNIKLSCEEAHKNVVENVLKIMNRYKGSKTKLLLETSSGKGGEIATKFSELGNILKAIKNKLPKDQKSLVGVCLDTCHIFSAGYDIRTSKETWKVLNEFKKTVGLNNLKCIHFNDSSYTFDSHTDCHNNIGCGYIGSRKLGGSLEGLQIILLMAKKYKIPVVLETPSRTECYPMSSEIKNKHKREIEVVDKMNLMIEKDLKSIKLDPKIYNMIDYC